MLSTGLRARWAETIRPSRKGQGEGEKGSHNEEKVGQGPEEAHLRHADADYGNHPARVYDGPGEDPDRIRTASLIVSKVAMPLRAASLA